MNNYIITVSVTEKITSDAVATVKGLVHDKTGTTVPIQVHAWGHTQEFLRNTDYNSLIVQGSLSFRNQELVIAATLAWPISSIDPDRLISQANLVGRAGQDPAGKYFESGSTLAEWSMATNNPPRRGEPQPASDWHNVKTWGRTAEIAMDYVRKGTLIAITGRLEIESWNDRWTGGERFKPVVNCQRLELLGSRSDDRREAPADDEEAPYDPAPASAAAPAPARPSAPFGGW